MRCFSSSTSWRSSLGFASSISVASTLHAADLAHVLQRIARCRRGASARGSSRARARARAAARAASRRAPAARPATRAADPRRRAACATRAARARARRGRSAPRCGARRRRSRTAPTIRNEPMSPVACACVPPHSSVDGPKLTTRTRSPYFSSKIAIAPEAQRVLVRLLVDARRAGCAGSARSRGPRPRAPARRRAPESCVKSKRSRSGPTSDPACVTCGPSTSRSAQCRRCVPEWLRTVAARAVGVDREVRPSRRSRCGRARRAPGARSGRRRASARPRSRSGPRRPRSRRCRRPARRSRRRTASRSTTTSTRSPSRDLVDALRRRAAARESASGPWVAS